MGTIIHDHIVITLDEFQASEISMLTVYLAEHFLGTSYGPIRSTTNGFVTFGVTTSGSKQGFDVKSEYTDKITRLLALCNIIVASFIHLEYGDSGDGPARVKECSFELRENSYDHDGYGG